MRASPTSTPVAFDNAFLGAGEAPKLRRMPRHVLPESSLHPAIRDHVANLNRDLVEEVQQAVAANDIVVVGMRQNPAPKRACKLLKEAGIPHTYLEYGSYLGEWRRRNALKMWSGWPTFPMVFVRGVLVGGASDLAKLIASGELKALLAAERAS